MKKGTLIHIKIQQFIFSRSLITFIWCVFLMMACVEPYQGDIPNFDDVLVVNAIITNENKTQQITLTRSYRFEEDGPQAETNANVFITTDDGLEFMFEETQSGIYQSLQPFAAEMLKDYTLNISTSDSKVYQSRPMQLPVSNTSIENMFADRITNDNGDNGVAIYIDSFDPSGNSKYYRHDFTETYKIIAPYWSPFDAVFVIEGEQTYDIPVILREQEERVCYGTDTAKSIIITSTDGLAEDRLKKYMVRFIDMENFILSYRYSILVKQYVLSTETFFYYETLKGLSQASSNVFSEDQPGFLAGNIFSVNNPEENVAGFFEVSTVNEKRIFFNYEDFFPNEELPPYAVGCTPFAPSSAGTIGTRELVNLIRDEKVRFYDYNVNRKPFEGEYIVVRPECGDCTTLGSNKVPDFWIE